MKNIDITNSATELSIENPELLRITNVTDTPVVYIREQLCNAINDFQTETNINLSEHTCEIFDSFSEHFDCQVENLKVDALIIFIDNIIVNFGFYDFVADFADNIEEEK